MDLHLHRVHFLVIIVVVVCVSHSFSSWQYDSIVTVQNIGNCWLNVSSPLHLEKEQRFSLVLLCPGLFQAGHTVQRSEHKTRRVSADHSGLCAKTQSADDQQHSTKRQWNLQLWAVGHPRHSEIFSAHSTS